MLSLLQRGFFFTVLMSLVLEKQILQKKKTQACLETFFGLGLIVGPTLGGFLFQVGGYMLPFTILGVLLIAAALFTYAILPAAEHCDVPQSGVYSSNCSDCLFK
jgi:MFS family permease